MKRTKLLTILLAIVLYCPMVMNAANQKKSVTQVTEEVELTDNVDYQITSTTPFADDGLVNIVNTDHAVLIFTQVKPSVVKSKWLSRAQLRGRVVQRLRFGEQWWLHEHADHCQAEQPHSFV